MSGAFLEVTSAALPSDYGEHTIFIGFGGLRYTRFPPYNLIDCAIFVGKGDPVWDGKSTIALGMDRRAIVFERGDR